MLPPIPRAAIKVQGVCALQLHRQLDQRVREEIAEAENGAHPKGDYASKSDVVVRARCSGRRGQAFRTCAEAVRALQGVCALQLHRQLRKHHGAQRNGL